MARKFKKRLAQKQPRSKKEQPILSISLIRKESLDKAVRVWKSLVSKFRSFKLKLAK